MSSLIPRRTKVGYAAAETGVQAVEILVRVHLLKFYTDVVGLPADLAGYAAALAVLWDAISDPIIGMLSDHTKSRFGHRRPYMLGGALLLAISIVAIFSPPALASNASRFGYLLLSYITLNTALTLVAVPHAALAAEMSADPNQRTSLFGYRLVLGNAGLLLGTVLPGVLIASTPEVGSAEPPSYFSVSWIVGLAAVVGVLVTVGATHRYERRRGGEETSPLRLLVAFQALRNKAFLPLFLAYAVAMIGVGMNGTLALYYYVDRLRLDQVEISWVFVVFVGAWSASVAYWIHAAKRYGKKRSGFWGVLMLGIVTSLTYPFFPPEQVVYPLIMAVVGGFFVGAVVLLDALVADIADYDEIKTGRPREGLYYGFWKLGGKVARALAIAIAGVMLTQIGVSPGEPRHPEAIEAIALLFGPGVGAFFVLGALGFLLMPLDAPTQARVQRILARRRARGTRLRRG